MAKKLTELFQEAVAKSQTEEGRRELREEQERKDAEAVAAAEAARAKPAAAGDDRTASEGPPGDEESPEVRPEHRPDPILPVVVESVQEAPEREAGRLAFGGIVEDRKSLPAQLPLLPRPEGPRVPLLELADYRGIATMARGRGAPLDLRLAVGVCVLTPHAARAARGRIAVTVRELRDFLFPNGWERRRDWPRIQTALWKAHNYMLPGRYEWRGRTVSGWVPFRLEGGVGDDAGLDDVVLIQVKLPPGSSHGPIIDRYDLTQLGVRSAPKFRAYIAAHSVAWRPGVTRRPHPRHSDFHVWSADAANYLVLTRADRRRLAFGAHDKGNRTHAQQDAAWENLPGIEIVTREACTPDGGRGWLVVPNAAAAAIRDRSVTAAEEQ